MFDVFFRSSMPTNDQQTTSKRPTNGQHQSSYAQGLAWGWVGGGRAPQTTPKRTTNDWQTASLYWRQVRGLHSGTMEFWLSLESTKNTILTNESNGPQRNLRSSSPRRPAATVLGQKMRLGRGVMSKVLFMQSGGWEDRIRSKHITLLSKEKLKNQSKTVNREPQNGQ